jgi:hypothetical protein
LSSWVTKKREKLTIRTKISSTSVCWRVSKQPFLCYILYIEQWGFHWSMCQTIANDASDPRCPGQTCVMFKFILYYCTLPPPLCSSHSPLYHHHFAVVTVSPPLCSSHSSTVVPPPLCTVVQ